MSLKPSRPLEPDAQAVKEAARTGLASAPLLFVFYETCALERQRQFFEQVLCLPIIENRFYPPHEVHGLVKYDAGTMILALNLCGQGRFERKGSEGLIAILTDDDPPAVYKRFAQYRGGAFGAASRSDVCSDDHHRHFQIRQAPTSGETNRASPSIRQLRLTVSDLGASIRFYKEILGLRLLSQGRSTAEFSAGLVELALDVRSSESAPEASRHDTYLLVFHTHQIEAAFVGLKARGLSFRSQHVGYSDIGGTARFCDPSGHAFCLYEPSEESLTWESAGKLKQIIDACGDVCAAERPTPGVLQ